MGLAVEYYPFFFLGIDGSIILDFGPSIRIDIDECLQEYNDKQICSNPNSTKVSALRTYNSWGHELGLSIRPYSYQMKNNFYLIPYLAFGWNRTVFDYDSELERVLGTSLKSSISNQPYYRASLELHYLGFNSLGVFYRLGVTYKDITATFPGLKEPIVGDVWAIAIRAGASFW